MPRPFILFNTGRPVSPIKRLFFAIIGLAILVFLFWVGFFVILALAALGIALAAINAIKMKLTGKPLFASRFQKFQEQQQAQRDHRRGGTVIEGEVVDHGEKSDKP